MISLLMKIICNSMVILQILVKCQTTIAKASTLQANGSGNGNNPM